MGKNQLLKLLLLLVAFAMSAPAATVSEHLRETLKTTPAASNVSVLVFLNDQLDGNEVASAKLATTSRQVIHEFVIGELKRHAAASQEPLVDFVRRAMARGEVVSFETYWIANALQITASRSFIETLTERSEIGAIIEDLPMQSLLIPEANTSTAGATGLGASKSLVAIGARQAWAQGYTGAGTLVASFDTGIDGSHPALAASWRGLTHPDNGQSWFDPIYGESAPHTDPSLTSVFAHGTHSLGVMVGKDDATGDTIGVAFGAQWISAMVVDIPGANFLQAFQWVADPDGNPNTIDDVPDVLNNSWGFLQNNIACSDIFWTPIDNLEALGTVVIFACGNEGHLGPMSLRNPANRATSPTTNFAVGAVDSVGNILWDRSSRGPSDCDGVSIKPEIVAPGWDVRTSNTPWNFPGTPYANRTGTSFAAPYVSGAVALLRQKNPNATVTQIKEALLASALDRGAAGEDNDYGRGLLNIGSALALIPPIDAVNVFVKQVQHVPIDPGMAVEVTVTLGNSGIGVSNVTGDLANAPGAILVDEGSSTFGNIPLAGSASNSADPFVLHFQNNILPGTQLSLDLNLSGSGGYQKTIKLYFTVGTALVKSKYNHVADSCRFTVSNFGAFGLAANSAAPQGGLGFTYPVGGDNSLYQCGLLIGVSPLGVSDGITNAIFTIDQDFKVAPGGNLTTINGGLLGDIETHSRYTDATAYRPLGITVEQRTAALSGPLDANYIILEFAVTNDQDTAMNDVYLGLFVDWDFPWGSGSRDRVGFSRDVSLGYMFDNVEPEYRGTAVLNSEGVSTFFAIDNAVHVYVHGVSEAAKYGFLTHGFADTANAAAKDHSYTIATGPFDLAPGESDTAAFAIIGSSNLNGLRAAAQRSRSLYRQATPVDDEGTLLPKQFELAQNFPNPFNPATEIAFDIHKQALVRLEVFNALGQRVATLVNEQHLAGRHVVQWYGLGDDGKPVASGVYLYRLTAGDVTATRKMILIK